MSKKTKISGQVGAIGDNAHSHGNTFIQNITNNYYQTAQPSDISLHHPSLPEINFEKCSQRWSLLAAIRKDIYRHFKYSRNPLLNSYHQSEATENCRKYLPGKRMKTPEILIQPFMEPWAPEKLWKGFYDPDSIRILESHQPIQISVHSMMVSTIAALLELTDSFNLSQSISCPSSTSPRHILSLTDGTMPCDVLFTADAGVYTAALDITKRFQRVFTVWEENHLALARKDNKKIKQVLVAPGTTQEIHHKLAADKGLLPKEKAEEDIENLLIRAKELSRAQAILLTYPKALPILKLKKFPFKELNRQTQGMTFGLYIRRDLPEDFKVAFVRCFVSAYNGCKYDFEEKSIAGAQYREKILKRMTQVPGFFNNYGFGTYAKIKPEITKSKFDTESLF